MFTTSRRNKQFIFASRLILRKIAEKLGCPTEWQGYANLVKQHKNMETMTSLYISWCRDLMIHINVHYKADEVTYPKSCVDALKAVLTCYNRSQIPNADWWVRELDK